MDSGLAMIIGFFAISSAAQMSAAVPCKAPAISTANSLETVAAQLKGRGRIVVTFMGYSGTGYENQDALLTRAAAVLDRLDPKKTIVNIGATIDGIGAVYELAHNKGFETVGIVSSQARNGNATLAPCAGTVFFIEDESWGGTIPGTTTLSPTSAVIVAVSDRIVAIGGGDVARDEFMAARRLGKQVEFFPADVNHANARARAAKNKQPAPTDFRGALGMALAAEKR